MHGDHITRTGVGEMCHRGRRELNNTRSMQGMRAGQQGLQTCEEDDGSRMQGNGYSEARICAEQRGKDTMVRDEHASGTKWYVLGGDQ